MVIRGWIKPLTRLLLFPLQPTCPGVRSIVADLLEDVVVAKPEDVSGRPTNLSCGSGGSWWIMLSGTTRVLHALFPDSSFLCPVLFPTPPSQKNSPSPFYSKH